MVTAEAWTHRRDGSNHNGEVDLDRDRRLVEQAQAGNNAAFDALYACYFARLERYCYSRLHDIHEAQDVAQDAFIRAWRALPNFAGDRRFYPWLSVIA
jgi:RNA polymerase sigma-70 factor (ECF subfamily)